MCKNSYNKKRKDPRNNESFDWPESCQSSLKEICRVLVIGGKVRMYCSRGFKIAENQGYLEKYLIGCGFKKIEIVKESFLSGGMVDENAMIHAYK